MTTPPKPAHTEGDEVVGTKRKVKIVFGAMAEPISDQLKRQGLASPLGNDIYRQAEADAITRLAVQGIATEAEVGRMRSRLAKRIIDQSEVISPERAEKEAQG